MAAASPTAMTTTPMCTTMPPLARPTNPRHPARAARAGEAPPAARPPVGAAHRQDQGPAGRGGGEGAEPEGQQRFDARARRPSTQTTTTTTPKAAGTASRPRMTSTVVLRQGRAGATAIRKSRARPTGTKNRLK